MLPRSVRNLWMRRQIEGDLDAELAAHRDLLIDEEIKTGATLADARRSAQLQMGGVEVVKDDVRDVRAGAWLESWLRDLQYGTRQLRRAPLFAATVVTTLALAIGANTLVFSILNAVLVRPLPYRDPDRIVIVSTTLPDGREAGFALQDYLALRERNRSFEVVGSASGAAGSIAVAPDDVVGAEPVSGQRIHAGLARVLDVSPVLGSWFTDADDPATADRKIVLSYGLWQRRFGGDPNVIGRLIQIDSQPATVTAVAPNTFEFLDASAQFWTPSRWSEATMRSPSRMLTVAARLRSNVTVASAQADMDRLAVDLAREFPQTNRDLGIRLETVHDFYTRSARMPLLLLQGLVGLVLLIACANVAGLLLARMSARQQEFGMRNALGASRSRLVRQLLTEHLLLAVLGCVGGLAVALAGLRLFLVQDPVSWLPRARGVDLDSGVLVFTAGIGVASTVLFGVLPSWAPSRAALAEARLRTDARGPNSRQPLRSLLVAGQIAAALVLVIAAGLLVNTLVRLNLNRPQIDPTNVLTFQLRLPLAEMVTPTGRDVEGFFTMRFSPRVSMIFSDIQERLRVLPGVQSVAGALAPPATLVPFRFTVAPTGATVGESNGTEPAAWMPVTADYFKTLGIAVTRGREFTKDDSLASPPVAIVNARLARQLWPGESPLGRQLAIDFVNDPPREVVGIVADVRETSEQHVVASQVFVPDAQLPLASRGWFQSPRLTITYIVRTATDPRVLVDPVRGAVAEIYRTQPIYNIRTLEEIMSGALSSWRQYSMLLGAFAAIAVTLALVGIFGVVAYSVEQRTSEIGIRRALGAEERHILKLLFHQAAILIAGGVIVGVAVSLAAARLLTRMLWGISPTDPLTFVVVVVGLTAAALMACYVPARRALRVTPLVALRGE